MKILVPTDFSENALAAAKYAATICVKNHYNLHLLHCYTAFSAGFSEADATQETDDSTVLKADILIKEWVCKLQEAFPTLLISFQNERGLLEETVPREAKRSDYIAIVMGTTGASAKKNVFWGSNTALIMAKSPIPIIAVPAKKVETTPQKVGLLTNFKQEELVTLKEFLHIFKTQVDLTLIHVHKETDDPIDLQNKLDSWRFNVQEFTGMAHIHEIVKPIIKEDKNLDTVPEVITQIIDNNNIDMILVSKSRKTFFQRLFTSSVSKAMVLELHTAAFFGKTI